MARLEDLSEPVAMFQPAPALPIQVSNDNLEDTNLRDNSQRDSAEHSSSANIAVAAVTHVEPMPPEICGMSSIDNESDSDSESDNDSSDELPESDEDSSSDSDSDSDNDSKSAAAGSELPAPAPAAAAAAAPIAMEVGAPVSASNLGKMQEQLQEQKLEQVHCTAGTEPAVEKASCKPVVQAPPIAPLAAATDNSDKDPRATALPDLQSGNEGKCAVSAVPAGVRPNQGRRNGYKAKCVGLVIVCFIIAFHATHHACKTRRQNELNQPVPPFPARQVPVPSFSVPVHSSLPPPVSNQERSAQSFFPSSDADSRSHYRSRASHRQKAPERQRDHVHENDHSWSTFFHDRADSWRAKFAQEHEQRLKDMYAHIENAKTKLQRWPFSMFETVKERIWNPLRSEEGTYSKSSQTHSPPTPAAKQAAASQHSLQAELLESRGLFLHAIKHWQLAAQDDPSGVAEFRLGNRAYWGWGMELNPQRAKELWAASARKGHLGGRARILAETDPLTALPLFIQLAQSDVDALAIAAAHSHTARIDLLSELRECSQQGHALCQAQLAECYAFGCCGLAYDPTTAIRLLEAAVDSELWPAQLVLARLLSTPNKITGKVVDVNRAAQLYTNALWSSENNLWSSESTEAAGAWKIRDGPRCTPTASQRG